MTHDHPLIVVEGIDASGKATLCKALSRLYGARVFSFPNYKTQTGKALLGHLKGEWYAARCPEGVWLNSLVRQALMTANRCEMQGAILDALNLSPVVCDRYTLSAEAYGVAEGLDGDFIRRLSAPLLKPDATIVLDLPAEEVAKRRPQARDTNERNLKLLSDAAKNYRDIAAQRGYCVIDATLPPAEVVRLAVAYIERVAGLRPSPSAAAQWRKENGL